MGARGRQAGNLLSVVPHGDVVSVPRAKPPKDFDQEHRELWVSIVSNLPAEHFAQENIPLLAAYCGHVITERKLTQIISHKQSAKKIDVDELDRLAKMRERESRAHSSLATRLRFTPHSRYAKDKKFVSVSAKPWEDAETEET